MDDLQAMEAALLSGMDGQSGSLEPLCSIDPTTRRITVPDNVFGVESDEQAKRVYFSVPTVVGDDFDLSKARIQINFRNPNGDLGVYLVKDFAADAEGNATFSWSLRRIVTQYKGTVSFIVCATILAAGNNRIDREWNTTLAQGQVLEGLEVTQEMESLAHDIIGQLILAADEADSAASAAVDRVAAAAQTQKDAALTAIRTESISQQNTITKKAQEALQDIPESYVELSNQVNQMAEDLQGMAPAIIPTATGSIVTITDGAARPAVEFISHIEPLQAGSGDPSPSNVRPISGWEALSASRTGANLACNEAISSSISGLTFTVSDDGTITVDGTANETVFYHVGAVTLKPGSYRMSGAPFGGSAGTYYMYFDTYFGARIIDNGEGVAFDAEEELTIALTIRINQGATVSKLIFRPGITHKDYEGSYEPYQGQTLSATLPETVYGGTLDWGTGVLKATWAKIAMADIGLERYELYDSGARFITYKFDHQPNGASGVDKIRSNICPTVANFSNQSYTGKTFLASGDGYARVSLYVGQSDIGEGIELTVDNVKSWLNSIGAYVVYELAKPITIQLTPQQLTTLKGTNNVWSSTGETELSYIADTKLYIDQKIAAIAAATL